VLVILTEWNSYRALDLKRIKTLMKAANIVDLRNIYRPEEVVQLGFRYTSLGRPQPAETESSVIDLAAAREAVGR
jgi:UDPglucose 6-dehydrogenase